MALRRRGCATLSPRLPDRLLGLAALGAVAVTLLSFGARTSWLLELTTHFRLQLAAASLLLTALLLWRRRRAAALVLAAAAAVNGVPVAPYLAGGAVAALPHAAASSGAGGGGLTLLSVNVRWSNHRYGNLLRILAARDADLVVVVELTPDWRRALASLDARYPYRLLAPRRDPYGVGMWSRYPLEAREIRLDATAAIDARVATPEGTIRVVGVHLRSPTNGRKAAERNRALADLTTLTRGARLPLVVVGDFNATPYSPYFSTWLSAAALRDAHAGLDITWPTFLPILGIPIDHCVVNSKLGIADFRRLPPFGSDHYPILCRVTLEHHR